MPGWSIQLIRATAAKGRFLSYKELADASGLDWSKARYATNTHLGNLIEYAHLKGLPLLSTVVVNKENVATGEMKPETLQGFASAARLLGYVFSDEKAFLREQQQRVFEWAGGMEDVLD